MAVIVLDAPRSFFLASARRQPNNRTVLPFRFEFSVEVQSEMTNSSFVRRPPPKLGFELTNADQNEEASETRGGFIHTSMLSVRELLGFHWDFSRLMPPLWWARERSLAN